MKQISYLKIGSYKQNRRVWIEGKRLADCGFTAGTNYSLVYNKDKSITIKKDASSKKIVSGRKNKTVPIIDVCNAEITEYITKHMPTNEKVKVIFNIGYITITQREIDAQAVAREAQIQISLENGTVTEGVVCAGGGIATHALSEGFKKAGIDMRCDWVLDAEGKYLQSGIDNVPTITKDTLVIEAFMEEVAPESLPHVDILSASMPCTAFSKAGISKKHLKFPEADVSNTAIIGLLQIIRSVNPAVVIHENVPSFGTSATCQIFVSYLQRLGYTVQQTILGKETGAFENRKRHILVAASNGIADTIDVDNNKPSMTAPKKLSEILEPIPNDSPRWKSYSYLAKKEVSDKAAGKGFRRQLLTGDATECGTIGRGYNKARSTEPFVINPWDTSKSRLLTPVEHARVKGIPEQSIAGVSDTVAHEILGQSILFPVFMSVGMMVANALQARQPAYAKAA